MGANRIEPKNIARKIMTIDAKNLFRYFPEQKGEPVCFDTRKQSLFALVVREELDMEDCPLFHQFEEVLKADKDRESFFEGEAYLLYDQFLIMDFGDIFLPIAAGGSQVECRRKEGLQGQVEVLVERGLDLRFSSHQVHMVPFDKSGNMSRKGRISFVNEAYLDKLNERLNLGIDFKDIPVILSKYYAYRGLYLSTSRRVECLEPICLMVIPNIRI